MLVGVAVAWFGAALYVLRCFSTCPTDPAEDWTGRLLTASIVLVGLVIVLASSALGTRWSRIGLGIVLALGAAVAACGVVALILVPSIEAPGDHSSSATAAVVAIGVGGAIVAAARAARRRAHR